MIDKSIDPITDWMFDLLLNNRLKLIRSLVWYSMIEVEWMVIEDTIDSIDSIVRLPNKYNILIDWSMNWLTTDVWNLEEINKEANQAIKLNEQLKSLIESIVVNLTLRRSGNIFVSKNAKMTSDWISWYSD